MTLWVLLPAAAAAGWVRSYWHISHLNFSVSAGHSVTVWYASHKGFEVCGDFGLRHADTGIEHHSTPLIGCVLEDKDGRPVKRLYPTRPTPKHHFAGFGVTPPRRDLVGDAAERYPATYASLVVPYWFLLLCGLLPPFCGVARLWRKWRRLRRGLCAACGYDLRSGPIKGRTLLDRCPECGAARGKIREESLSTSPAAA